MSSFYAIMSADLPEIALIQRIWKKQTLLIYMNTLSSTAKKAALLGLFVTLLATPVSAQGNDMQCLCHNVQNNPHEVCSDDNSHIVGHQIHLDSGMDVLGACPTAPTPTAGITPTASITPTTTISVTPTETPAVPEFGLITGLTTLAVSAGSYVMMKRKV